MAIKEVTLSQDIENETGRYNEKTGWVRLYFNTDNGYIWAEDTKNIVTVFEKGKDGSCGCCCGGTVTAEDVVKKCNEILASL